MEFRPCDQHQLCFPRFLTVLRTVAVAVAVEVEVPDPRPENQRTVAECNSTGRNSIAVKGFLNIQKITIQSNLFGLSDLVSFSGF